MLTALAIIGFLLWFGWGLAKAAAEWANLGPRMYEDELRARGFVLRDRKTSPDWPASEHYRDRDLIARPARHGTEKDGDR